MARSLLALDGERVQLLPALAARVRERLGGVLRSGKAVLFDATVHVLARDGGPLVVDPATMAAQLAGGVVQLTPEGDATVYLLAPGAPAVDPLQLARAALDAAGR